MNKEVLPFMIEAKRPHVDLAEWANNNRMCVDEHLRLHGALLLRDFDVRSIEDFARFSESVSSELLDYQEYSTPRTEVARHIYTSTDYPASQSIFLHNESSFRNAWPMRLLFFCGTPAIQGGRTPLADMRRVLRRIPPRIIETFAEKGWMYVRNFGGVAGPQWQAYFNTREKTTVEKYCIDNDIQFEWKDGDRLRISAVRKAIREHPYTKEAVWFNHATVFHVTTLESSIRETLLKVFRIEELPLNSYYGDGSEIGNQILEELRSAHRLETVNFRWRQGDVLVLDNMLVGHGRESFTGPRKVFAAFAELHLASA